MSELGGDAGAARRWFVGSTDGDDGRSGLRLLCLPYAGGGPSLYRSWTAAMAGVADVLAVCLPGRAHRWHEPPDDDPQQLVDAMADAVDTSGSAPLAIFGHSLGALLGFELTRRLAARGSPALLLIVAACPPPSALPSGRSLHRQPDDVLIAELRRMGATPTEVLDNTELMRLLLPVIRSDFALSERYAYTPAPPLPTPILTLAGRQDQLAPPHTMAGWDGESRSTRHVRLDGGHLFLHSAEAAVHDQVRSGVRAALAEAGERHRRPPGVMAPADLSSVW